MSVVANQHARDAAIYRAWIDGRRMVDLAEQYGVTHSAISQAVARHQAALPAPERGQEVRRAADLCDDLIAVYIPRARAGNPAASREARGWLQLKAKWLGIDRRQVEVSGTIEHEHYAHPAEPVPTVAELFARWEAEGVIPLRAEITREHAVSTIPDMAPDQDVYPGRGTDTHTPGDGS